MDVRILDEPFDDGVVAVRIGSPEPSSRREPD
jgi:hypothetical protein